MLIEIKFCISSDLLSLITADSMAEINSETCLPNPDDDVRINIEFISKGTSIQNIITKRGASQRRAIIIISESLVTDIFLPEALLNLGWSNSISIGLIGISRENCLAQNGVDAVIETNEIKTNLVTTIQHLISKLWFKIPPPVEVSRRFHGKKLSPRIVDNKNVFKKCLSLRHKVYSSMGYLEPEIANAKLKIDMDWYDQSSTHYHINDPDNENRVIATMRLIIRKKRRLSFGANSKPKVGYEKWCADLANEEYSVYGNILNSPPVAAFPASATFEYFNDMGESRLYEIIKTDCSCEISRVIVDPMFRGNNLLERMVSKAINVARKEDKKYVMLECSPYHECMYKKLGFVAIENNGHRYAKRANRLDSWALIMYKNIGDENANDAETSISIPIRRKDGKSYCLSISKSGLTGREINNRLSSPYSIKRLNDGLKQYTAKGCENGLLGMIQYIFTEMPQEIAPVINEVYDRLPQCEIKLVSGKSVYHFSQSSCESIQNEVIHNDINKWLEDINVTI